MSYLTARETEDSEIFSVVKPHYLSKLQKSYYLPNISPSEQRIKIQRPLFVKNPKRPGPDLQTVKGIIEKTLETAKKYRKSINTHLQESKDNIKPSKSKFFDDNKVKSSFTTKLIAIKPIRFRKILPKSPIDFDKSIIVYKYHSRNKFIPESVPQSLNRKLSSDSDKDKMDSNLDMYYL
jgi:hypothetical protein